MKYFLLCIFLVSVVSAKQKFIFDMTVMPHVLVNLHKGYVAFHLENRTVYKKLNDPVYIRAVNDGTLDRLLRSPEVTLDRQGFFPLPIKIIDFDQSMPVPQAEIAQEYLDLAKYLSKPHSDYLPILNDLSFFIRAVKTNQLHARGFETSYVEDVSKRTGLLNYEIKDDFTENIPVHNDFLNWMKRVLTIDFAADQDINDLNDLTLVDGQFLVLAEPERKVKSLKAENSKTLAKLMLAGYPIMLNSRSDTFILTAIHIESLYAHYKGRRYVGTLKSLGSKRLENNITIFKLQSNEQGLLKTALDDEFAVAQIAPVVQAAVDEVEKVQYVSDKELLAEPGQYRGKKIIFSCRVTAARFMPSKKTMYLKFGQHFLEIPSVSKGFYEVITAKVVKAKAEYALRGNAVLKFNTPLFFKGVFKGITNKKLLQFDDLKSLSFDAKMPLQKKIVH
jgi:hypothetical protein